MPQRHCRAESYTLYLFAFEPTRKFDALTVKRGAYVLLESVYPYSENTKTWPGQNKKQDVYLVSGKYGRSELSIPSTKTVGSRVMIRSACTYRSSEGS